MAQSVARQWPALPTADPESLALWARQVTRLLQEGAIIAGLGPGDVVGPAGPVGDGNVVLFDGTTGLLLQDSGLPIGASGNRWGVIPFVHTDGVMEIGQFIDFHNSDADTDDYAVRLHPNNGNGALFFTPAETGLLRQIIGIDNASKAQGDIIYRSANDWVSLPAGTAGQFLQTAGAAANPAWASTGPTVVAAQATTSGTAIDFGGLPASVSRIVMNLGNVSLSGNDDLLVRIGDSGGVETTGYESSSNFIGGSAATSTIGFLIRLGAAASDHNGQLTLTKLSTTHWVASGIGKTVNTPIFSTGFMILSAGPLDRVQLTTTGTNTFDTGSANIIYD